LRLLTLILALQSAEKSSAFISLIEHWLLCRLRFEEERGRTESESFSFSSIWNISVNCRNGYTEDTRQALDKDIMERTGSTDPASAFASFFNTLQPKEEVKRPGGLFGMNGLGEDYGFGIISKPCSGLFSTPSRESPPFPFEKEKPDRSFGFTLQNKLDNTFFSTPSISAKAPEMFSLKQASPVAVCSDSLPTDAKPRVPLFKNPNPRPKPADKTFELSRKDPKQADAGKRLDLLASPAPRTTVFPQPTPRAACNPAARTAQVPGFVTTEPIADVMHFEEDRRQFEELKRAVDSGEAVEAEMTLAAVHQAHMIRQALPALEAKAAELRLRQLQIVHTILSRTGDEQRGLAEILQMVDKEIEKT
jgi:hypothetical protein